MTNIIEILLPNFPRALPNDVTEKVRKLNAFCDYRDGIRWEYRVEEVPVHTIKSQSQLLALLKKKYATNTHTPYSQVVIVSLFEKEHPDLIGRLHLASRNLTVVGITPDKENMYLEQLCPKRREIVNSSLQNFGDMLREAVEKPCS